MYWQFGDSERNTSYEGRSVDAQKCLSFIMYFMVRFGPVSSQLSPKNNIRVLLLYHTVHVPTLHVPAYKITTSSTSAPCLRPAALRAARVSLDVDQGQGRCLR